MLERRLDVRLSPHHSRDIAQPSVRGVIVGRWFRPIVTALQLAVPIYMLLVFLFQSSNGVNLWPVVVTALYCGIYVVRFRPPSAKDDVRWWLGLQLLGGALELMLLGLLYLSYARLMPGHVGFYWWGLYILPVYRMGEVAGTKAWALSFGFSVLWLLLGEYVAQDQGDTMAYQVQIVFSQVTLLFLATFLTYYILRGWDLTISASRYWTQLLSEIASRDPDWKAERAMCNVFEEGLRDFVKAQWGALWVLENNDAEPDRINPSLALFCCLKKTGISSFHNMNEGLNQLITPEETQLDARRLIAMDKQPQTAIIYSSRNGLTERPIGNSFPRPKQLRSHLIARIGGQNGVRTLGFIEIGFTNRIWTAVEWKVLEERVRTFADSLAELRDHIDQVRLNRLKSSLANIEHQAEDESSLFTFVAKALTEYFRLPTIIINYSTLTGNIDTVSGAIEPTALDWLKTLLAEQGAQLREENDPGCVLSATYPQSPTGDRPAYFFIYPLLKHQASIELIIINDFLPALRATDRQALHDSASLINSMIARRRAASLLQPDYLGSAGRRATRAQLQQLAENIMQETSADVIVMYEFENERPKLPPIYAGELRDEQYLHAKPIVIEDPNPLLRVARSDKPIFNSDVCSSALAQTNGSGLNRHGDAVFVLREGITSSIGVPLRTKRGVVGVIWLNFREQQTFDYADQQRYIQLFSRLPAQLEQLQSLETARMLAEYNTKERLRLDWHHHTLQDLFAAGFCITTAIHDVELGDKANALDNLHQAIKILEGAEEKAHKFSEDMDEVPFITGIEHMLRQHVENLQGSWRLPETFSVDGLGAIPETLVQELYWIICESITNAVKHGRATTVSVQAASTDGVLQVVIRDNGKGFVPSPDKYRNGLRGTQARIKQLNGKVRIGSKPGAGTGLALEIPINDVEAV